MREPRRRVPRLTAMTSTIGSRLALIVPLFALVAACGSDRGTPSTAGAAAATPAGTAGEETLVSCGGQQPGWPVSAMDGGIDSQHPTGDLAAALEGLAQEAGIDAPRALQDVSTDEAPWFVLTDTADSATVATGAWDSAGPGADGQVVYLEEADGTWKARSWGDCTDLAPVIAPGLQWVRVVAASDPDPSSVELTVTVNEVQCTSGRNPRPFLRAPRIVENDESVTLFLRSEAPKGAHNCMANPTVRQVLHLEQPLGDRVLLDGSTWPHRPIASGNRD